MVGDGHRVEFGDGVVALENRARVFPGDGAARLDLGPEEAAAVALADAALGHEVVDAAASLLVAGIPVLHGGILDLRILFHDDLHHGRVELRFVAHRGGAALEVAHVGALVGHDQRAFELAGAARIDAEITGEFHRAAHPFRDVAERAVAEDRRVEGRIEVVARRHHAGQVLAHQVGIVPHRLGERAEDDALFRQRLLEGGLDRY